MKHGNKHYAQVSRDVWDPMYNLSDNAKLLFFWLNELEQRYSKEDDSFFRSNKQLCEDLGWSMPKLKKAKAELVLTDFIRVTICRKNNESGKQADNVITWYKIMK